MLVSPLSVTPVISVSTECTVMTTPCQALFTLPFFWTSRLPSPLLPSYLPASRNGFRKTVAPMPQPKQNRPTYLAALLACLLASFAVAAATQEPADDTTRSSAVCPIVYQLDQAPSSHGYHYSFFGNGFFINEEGYLLTAAHVLGNFRDGGQPYILVSRRNGPPIMLKASIIATDMDHDVAILRVLSNPFVSHYKVTFLPLASESVSTGESVLALSLHPPKQQNAHTFEVPREDRFSGEVLSYESTQLERSAPATEVFLLSHPVNLGQSGSPVLSQNTGAVVGLVEGRWLRSSPVAIAQSSATSSETPGAAVPIRYAISLLERQSINWHTAQPRPRSPAASAQ